MSWWITALVYVVGTVLYDVLRPKPKFDAPTPSSLGDFNFPTIGEGRPIPIVWGTCKLTGPMVTWYGDLTVQAIKERVRSGLFSHTEITKGYRYHLGIQMALCSGRLDEVVEIRFGDHSLQDSEVYISADADRTRFSVSAESLFGGDESGGGVKGRIYVYHGTTSQEPNAYLEAQAGEDLPAWRGISYAVYEKVYVGTSPYIAPFSTVVRRCPNGLSLTGGAENIAGDANPACMLYDILTSPPSATGLGLPAGLLDLTAFRAVGQTLAGESMGLSMVQDRATTARDLVLEILRHIDGIIYVEPSIGLLTIKLVRFDYNAAGLPVLDSDSCTVKSFSRPSWGDTKNTIRVSYVDRADGFTEKTAQAQELASIEVQGGKVSVQEVAFRGFSNAQSAQRAAARALAGLAYPLASVTIEADRSAWSFRPGSVFRLVWPPLGIEGMICRVVRVGTGRLDSGKIEIEAMEDVFAVDWTCYSTPPSTGWVDPAGDVPDLTALTAFEAPYEIAKGLEGQSAHYAPVSVMAARGEVGVSMGYNVYSQSPDSGFIDPTWIVQLANPPLRRVPYFTPTATLAEDISELTDEIVLLPGPDCDRLASVNQMDFATGVNIMVIAVHSGPPTPIGQIHGSEFIAFRDVVRDEDGTIRLQVLARGCLDGPPHAHAAGTRVWFISYGSDIVRARTPEPGEDNPLVRVTYFLYRPYNNRGEQPIPFGVSSGDMQIHIRRSEYWHQSTDLRRSVWPYCPTDVRFNGESYPESITGELTVSWAHRNRLGTWSYENSGQTAEPEPGTVYDVLVYGELGTLIHTEADLTGTSWTYSEALEIAESGLGRLNDHLRVVITTRRGSYVHGVGGRSITWEFDRV